MAIDVSRLVIETGLDDVYTNARTRASATNPLGTNWISGSGTPVSLAPAGTVTLTAANLLTGIVTIAASAPNTATLDTAANIVASVNNSSAGAVIGDYIDCLVVNGSGTNAVTLAAGSGGAFDTNQANRGIPVNTSKSIYIRLTNVTPGAEAYVIYF